jgi:hypothetical protein
VTAPHDAPSAADLAQAVREHLESNVLDALDGHARYLTHVAVHVLGTVERELRLGPAQAEAHAARLARLGFDSDAALAAAIRRGDLDDRVEEVLRELEDTVRDKLRVANPRYLDS